MVKRRSNAAPAEPAAVTGVASGGLGTAANLEDTQLWDLEELRAPGQVPDPEPKIAAEVPRAPAKAQADAAAPAAAPAATAARANAPVRKPRATRSPSRSERAIVQEPQPLPASVVRPRGGQRRTAPIAAAAIGILVLATVLALRDGLPGGTTRGSGDAAGAFPSVPSIATSAPKATAKPDAGSGGGHGNGGGKGNGKGHGGEED
jgi:hypothetical protein